MLITTEAPRKYQTSTPQSCQYHKKKKKTTRKFWETVRVKRNLKRLMKCTVVSWIES